LQLDESTRVSTIKSILQDQKITVLTPKTIAFPLTFEEGMVSFTQQSDLDNTKSLISTFVKNFVHPRGDRILFWQENATVKLGVVAVEDNVPELHYITIGVR
jgi:hypothetical protein